MEAAWASQHFHPLDSSHIEWIEPRTRPDALMVAFFSVAWAYEFALLRVMVQLAAHGLRQLVELRVRLLWQFARGRFWYLQMRRERSDRRARQTANAQTVRAMVCARPLVHANRANQSLVPGTTRVGTDAWQHILEFLDGVSLARARCVSIDFRRLASEPTLWRRLCAQEDMTSNPRRRTQRRRRHRSRPQPPLLFLALYVIKFQERRVRQEWEQREQLSQERMDQLRESSGHCLDWLEWRRMGAVFDAVWVVYACALQADNSSTNSNEWLTMASAFAAQWLAYVVTLYAADRAGAVHGLAMFLMVVWAVPYTMGFSVNSTSCAGWLVPGMYARFHARWSWWRVALVPVVCTMQIAAVSSSWHIVYTLQIAAVSSSWHTVAHGLWSVNGSLNQFSWLSLAMDLPLTLLYLLWWCAFAGGCTLLMVSTTVTGRECLSFVSRRRWWRLALITASVIALVTLAEQWLFPMVGRSADTYRARMALPHSQMAWARAMALCVSAVCALEHVDRLHVPDGRWRRSRLMQLLSLVRACAAPWCIYGVTHHALQTLSGVPAVSKFAWLARTLPIALAPTLPRTLPTDHVCTRFGLDLWLHGHFVLPTVLLVCMHHVHKRQQHPAWLVACVVATLLFAYDTHVTQSSTVALSARCWRIQLDLVVPALCLLAGTFLY